MGRGDTDIQVNHPMIRRRVVTTARQLAEMKPDGRVVDASKLALQLLGTPNVDGCIQGVATRGTHKSTGDFKRLCVFFFFSNWENEERAQFCSFGSSTIQSVLAADSLHINRDDLPAFLTPEVTWTVGQETVDDHAATRGISPDLMAGAVAAGAGAGASAEPEAEAQTVGQPPARSDPTSRSCPLTTFAMHGNCVSESSANPATKK